MKKLAIILFALMPAMLFAQYQVQVASGEPQTLKVSVPAYNDRIPAAIMTMKFDFNPDTETLLVTMGSGGMPSPNYDKVWLPQHDISYSEMPTYMKNRGVKLKKAQTYVDQENFLNLGSQPLSASIAPEGMTFSGAYELVVPKKMKVKKELDKQMVPLDGKMELNLSFKIAENRSDLKLTLRNPMPMHRSGSKAIVDFVANDITIDIQLDRCKESRPLLATIEEYVEMFEVGEAKVNELKRKNRSLMNTVVGLLNDQYSKIDLKRFKNTGCAEIDEKCEELESVMERINGSPVPPPPVVDNNKCGVTTADIKSTTSKLNSIVNKWSTASTPAQKAEHKASFDAAVKSFDAKLNSLSSDCKKKIDSKVLKDYDFVKKLVK
jgi:hypothetical protein